MADRSAWVVQAFRRYHAGQITLTELLAMVREHRQNGPEVTDNPGA